MTRPELRRRELVLYEKQRGALRVVAASRYPAGTPLAEVTTGRVEPHDPHADRVALLQLAAWCEQFSPSVGIEPPDNLCLDVSGLARLFGGEDRLAQQVLRAFQRQGLTIRWAIADTLGAAWALAHFAPASVVSPPGKMLLADLPIAALRLPDQAPLLAELGIERIGQLWALPREALAARFNPQLLLRLDQAVGLVAEPIGSHRPPPEIVVETELEYPVEDRQIVERLLGDLCERVAQALADRQQGALQVDCELRCEVKPIKLSIGLFRATAQARHLLELARMQLERIGLPGPVAAVKLSVLASAPLQFRQLDLFESSHREDRWQVGRLIDRLSNRLGREAVVRAIPQPDAQPELAFRYEPLTGAFPAKPSNPKASWKSLPRPLRLENEPTPLTVLSVAPEGPPIQFQWHGSQRVAQAWGPERIQTGWWRGRHVQRDYYRVETTTGQRFWLFRRLVDGKWFFHGAFD